MVDWPIQIISQRYFSPLFASGADLINFRLLIQKNYTNSTPQRVPVLRPKTSKTLFEPVNFSVHV
jgi:hypothetical protein